ncbi:reticulon-1a isoform X1 [Scleropages formosus]|uniref:Reticulon n=1 Tax=Scleropages formosus TaxID=113540 RepID=A0A8C9U7T1_SCLFO|nr:reticulon-1 isoform X1 [Scleropages formosus]
MSAQLRHDPGSEGRRFGDHFEALECLGGSRAAFAGGAVVELDAAGPQSDGDESAEPRPFLHQRELDQQKAGAPVAMETASTGDPDFDLLQTSADISNDLYTSLLSGQSYPSRQEAPYFSGEQKRSEPKRAERMPSLESHGGMFSSDSGIEMTPGESIDVARNLLDSEKMESSNYMDISGGEEHLREQQRPLDTWTETGATGLGRYLEKGPPEVETLGPALDSHAFPYVEDPSDEELSDTPRTASPVKITLTDAGPSPRRPPQISVSERESILSLGVEGVPTVTLSEPEDDSPGSCTPPLTEEDSPSDTMFRASGARPVSSVQPGAPSQPSLPAARGEKPPSPRPLHAHDQDSSAESGDSEIELVSDEPPPREQTPSTGYMSFGHGGSPAPAPSLPTPTIQYSILREEREAELDSELIIESCDASSASEESPKREQDPPTPKARAAEPPPSPTFAAAPTGSPLRAPREAARDVSKKEDAVPPARRPPPVAAPPELRVERPGPEEQGPKKGPAKEGRRDSARLPEAPVFLRGWSKQKAMDLLYWRDLKQTGVMFGSVLLLLFSLTQFSVVSVGAYLALAALSATISFRVYKSVLQAVQKTDEGHPFKTYLEMEISLSQEQIQKYADMAQQYLNCTLKELRRLFLVQDLVDSLKFAVLMWLLTYVGALFNGLTLLILAVVSMFTMPVVYEKYQAQIDQYLGLVRTHVNCVVGKIQEKIPGAKRKTE